MAMAMNSLKVPAISLNAFQVAMHTTSVYGNARLKRIDVERIRHELEQRKIVIVTGFQGINKYDDYTTLGRGGSAGNVNSNSIFSLPCSALLRAIFQATPR